LLSRIPLSFDSGCDEFKKPPEKAVHRVSMKFSGVLFIIYSSVILNSLLLFFFGEKGCLEYESLAAYKTRLEANLRDIKEKNRSLSDKLNFVATNREQMSIIAREIGYYKKDENAIILEGYSPPGSFYEIGNYVNRGEESKERNGVLRVIAICSTVCMIILYGIISKKKKSCSLRHPTRAHSIQL
jgi:thioredoxin-related protein